jgi:penicillin amidase
MPLGRNVPDDADSTGRSRNKGRRLLPGIFAGFALLLVLCAVAAVLGGAWWLDHAMRAALPQLDGLVNLPELSAPVTVRRDAHGVPHIQAASLDDLFEAQGYVTAQDRLWEMDMARRMAAGDTAEILGPSQIAHDRMQRVLQMRPTAERLTASLNPRDRRYFEDYTRGVNAFIYAATHANGGHLSPEFGLLHYQPRPWQPVDCALIVMGMVQMLDEHWDSKLDRERVVARLGPTLAASLYPVGSWRDHPPTQIEPDLSAPQPVIPAIPLDSTQSSVRDLLRLRDLVEGGRADCEGCAPGSNEWVVSGAHTASGKPILTNDMHLGHEIPNIWYESDLQSGDFHVAGLTVPGIPFIVAGHNAHVAWGFTSLYADMQDLYVEKLNQLDEYFEGGAWHPLEHDRETIRVRFGHDVSIDVPLTPHGPIISQLIPGETRAIALKWSAYDVASAGIDLFDLDSAADWPSFRTALSHWWGPSQNVVYSDDQGHIAYQAAGNIPNRPMGIAAIPISDAAHEWNGYIPFDQLPAALDPANGILATANSRITPDGYATPITGDWADPYRNERIWKWLAGKDKLRGSDMIVLQTDVYSEVDQELAQRFAYAIDHASKADSRLRIAADILRTWDGVVSVNSSAAAIVAAAKSNFWPMLLRPRLGDDWRLYQWSESGFAREQLIMNEPAAWLPSGYASWDDFLANVVSLSLSEAPAPASLNQWRYGYAHPVELAHPLYGMLPWFSRWTGTGIQPQSGDTSTVKQVGRTFGPSQRFTIDWSDPDGATENIVMGESGDPFSAYYRDQWPFWYGGRTFALPFGEAAVATQTSHTLRLVP